MLLAKASLAKSRSTSMIRRIVSSKVKFSNNYLLRNSCSKFSSEVKGSSFYPSSMLNGSSVVYIQQMHQLWKKDPASVHQSWNVYFQNMEAGISPQNAYFPPPTLGAQSLHPSIAPILSQLMQAPQLNLQRPKYTSSVGDTQSQQAITDTSKILLLLRSYQVSGHEVAKFDPLQLDKNIQQHGKTMKQDVPKQLNYKEYGFTQADLDRQFYINTPQIRGFMKQKQWKLGDLLENLQETYCNHTGIEYMHITNVEECNWIRDKFQIQKHQLTPEEKKKSLGRLLKATNLQTFLHTKFTTKRFGLEGCETFITGLRSLIDKSKILGVKKFFIGMPHRGRLNVLANILKKPIQQIFAQFQGAIAEFTGQWGNSGDVKYHLGITRTVDGADIVSDLPTFNDHQQTLLPNPSHLQCVNPVVLGRVRAQIDFSPQITEENRFDHTLGILVHGDAAFAGQGVVYESMQMEDLHGYRCGGTIHIVVNNQIGFTTTPREARTSLHPTEVAKTIGAPIFHVNANQPEAVERVFSIAADYRNKFKQDVVIDLVGYRKYGHNELDQPMFTQPTMYKQIAKTRPVSELYQQRLVNEGVITSDEGKAMVKSIHDEYQQAFQKSKTHKFKQEDWRARWIEEINTPEKYGHEKLTGVPMSELRELGKKINTLPQDLKPHNLIAKVYKARLKAIETGVGIDWGCAEALSFATLLQDGFHVRVSGQDVERGTFSHRHSVIHDQEKDKAYSPLSYITDKTKFRAINSHLSQFAVLGFELGYTYANPNTLVIWEAQFGDFANGAQVIIDQFISSGEAKWNTPTGIVINLPHGFDGAGPEHSSGRVQRYLQLMDDGVNEGWLPDYEDRTKGQDQTLHANMSVVNCSTAANYFHVLRRQMRRHFRKPLIIMSPKKLLKLKEACSSLEQFDLGLRFQRVIPETDKKVKTVDPKKIKKMIICSGQVYYDLVKSREKRGIQDIAIVRMEQIAPIPYDLLWEQMGIYTNAKVYWCQEEHENAGAWTYAQPRINILLEKLGRDRIGYYGRKSSASTATGYAQRHEEQLNAFLDAAFS